jgi:hypothetical protein
MAVTPRGLLVHDFEICATAMLRAFQGGLRLLMPAGAAPTWSHE